MRLGHVLRKYKLDPLLLAQILCQAARAISESGLPE
jgi:hypothetical protein